MISLSTVWNIVPGCDINEKILQIKATGVDGIELGYTVEAHQLAEILSLAESVGLTVNSVHNFCPSPDTFPSSRHPSGYYRLSSLDEQERRQAIYWTKKTIDTAVQARCGVVVFHAGTVDILDNIARELVEAWRAGKSSSPGYMQLKEHFIMERKKESPQYFDMLYKSLDDVLSYAAGRNVVLGLETRYYPNEIPNFEEINILLNAYRDKGLLYWHDVGHAQANEDMGITQHRDFLEAYHQKMAGVHIHGISQGKDHHAPFIGDFDIMPIADFFKKDIIKVIEAQQASEYDIRNAVTKLKNLL